jgi:hypothetical protein
MKIKDEREKLEKLIEASPEKITDDVPTPGNIPPELESHTTMGIDFSELRKTCENEARIILNDSIGFILSEAMIKNNNYLKNKLEVDILTLSGMLYQLKVNEAMQKALMEEVDRGFMNPRMFEVFSGLSKTIAEINKQLIQTLEALKVTYKDVKSDIREKETDALGPKQDSQGMITQGDGSSISFGTKELINKMKKTGRRYTNDEEDIQDTEEVN